MNIQSFVKPKANLLERQLIAKVKGITVENEIKTDINSLKGHPEITTLTMELLYNLAYEFKLKNIDKDKMVFDLLVSIFNLTPELQTVVKNQINSHVKNNDIVLISNYTKLKSCVWNFLKKSSFLETTFRLIINSHIQKHTNIIITLLLTKIGLNGTVILLLLAFL